MRRFPLALACLVVVGACGDNNGDDAMMEPCHPDQSALPATGMYTDPQALKLPDSCVENGLANLPGRWFLVDPTQYFRYEYPKYQGSCTAGFTRVGNEEDHDPTDDGYTFYTWSDGTRYWQRSAYEYQGATYISIYTACMTGPDSLHAVYLNYDNDRGERTYETDGKRFAPKDEVASGLTLVGEIGQVANGPMESLNLVIDNQRAYVAGFDGLDIFDVSDPTHPTVLGKYGGSWNDVKVVNDGTHVVAFLSPRASQAKTEVVDVTVPSAPQMVQLLQEYSHSVFIQERNNVKELYLATYNESVPKYDVTAPLTPVRLGMAIVPGDVSGVHDLYVDGDKIYANNTQAGLVAFDTSGGFGASNVELGRFTLGYSHASWAGTINGRQLVLAGDEGWTRSASGAAHLSILDGDPASPTFMKELAIYQTRPEVGIHNFEVHGNLVYIAYYHDGVRIVDLSDATQPREVAHYNTWQEDGAFGGTFEGALGIRKVGDTIYVADLERGLLIFKEQ
jgi:hypothetical protein